MISNLPSKDEARHALHLAAPIAGAYLVLVVGLLLEFIIVGNALGGKGLAALGLAATLSLVIVLSFHAVEVAAQAIIARRSGENNRLAAGQTLDNALLISFVSGVPLVAAFYAVGPAVFGAENPIIEALAMEYFRWRLPSIPFFIAALAIIGFFNGIGKPRYPMIVYAVILSLNATLCYVLVNGVFRWEGMGISGAGLAQTISTFCGFVLFLVLLVTKGYRARFQCLHLRKNFSLPLLRRLMKLGAPVFVQQFFGNFSMYLFMIINGKVPDGGISLAASTIARNIAYLTYLPSIGFGIAAATLVGQALGENDRAKATRGGFAAWMIGAAFMMTGGLLFIAFRFELVDVFLRTSADNALLEQETAANPVAVANMAALLLIIVGCYQIFESANTILGKALQGAGSTFFVMCVAVAFQWVLFLPLAWFLAIPMGLGAVGSTIAFGIQLALAGSTFMGRYLGGKWQEKEV